MTDTNDVRSTDESHNNTPPSDPNPNKPPRKGKSSDKGSGTYMAEMLLNNAPCEFPTMSLKKLFFSFTIRVSCLKVFSLQWIASSDNEGFLSHKDPHLQSCQDILIFDLGANFIVCLVYSGAKTSCVKDARG